MNDWDGSTYDGPSVPRQWGQRLLQDTPRLTLERLNIAARRPA